PAYASRTAGRVPQVRPPALRPAATRAGLKGGETASFLPRKPKGGRGGTEWSGKIARKAFFLLAVPESGTGYPEIAAAGARMSVLISPASKPGAVGAPRAPATPRLARGEEQARGAEGRKARPGPRKRIN